MKTTDRKKKFVAFGAAFVAFIALNIGFSIPILISLSSGARNEGVDRCCDTAFKQLTQATVRPDIVLMGSSLMMSAIWGYDSATYKNVGDFFAYHRSQGLETALAKRGLKNLAIVNLALPGAMISDGFLIANKLLDGPNAPGMIVYGIAPRDFMDDFLTGDTRTPIFERLLTVSDIPSLGDLYLPTWSDKMDFVTAHLFYFYGRRWNCQQKVEHFWQDAVVSKVASKQNISETPSAPKFDLLGDRTKLWATSIAEYRARYRHFNEEQFKKQIDFLSRFLAAEHKRGTRVLLVNMPLTQANRELMPEGVYAKYLLALNTTAKHCNVTVLDPQIKERFADADFFDTAHLNGSGGAKLIAQIADCIEHNPHQELALRRQ